MYVLLLADLSVSPANNSAPPKILPPLQKTTGLIRCANLLLRLLLLVLQEVLDVRLLLLFPGVVAAAAIALALDHHQFVEQSIGGAGGVLGGRAAIAVVAFGAVRVAARCVHDRCGGVRRCVRMLRMGGGGERDVDVNVFVVVRTRSVTATGKWGGTENRY